MKRKTIKDIAKESGFSLSTVSLVLNNHPRISQATHQCGILARGAERAREVASRGAGEILLTSMDCDGEKGGFDIALYQAVGEAVEIPITASGGAGKMEHFAEVFKETAVSAALGASIFHFREVEIATLKIFLSQCGIPMRNRT